MYSARLMNILSSERIEGVTRYDDMMRNETLGLAGWFQLALVFFLFQAKILLIYGPSNSYPNFL